MSDSLLVLRSSVADHNLPKGWIVTTVRIDSGPPKADILRWQNERPS